MPEPDNLTKSLSQLGPAGSVALVHGLAAGNAIQRLAAEDPEMAALLASVALDSRFVIEKAQCAHSGLVFRDEAERGLRAVFR